MGRDPDVCIISSFERCGGRSIAARSKAKAGTVRDMILKYIAFAIVTLAAGSLAQAQALVEGSVEAGKAKSVTCAACHGADGNSVNPSWPNLAGQHATYIVQQLQAFKTGTRTDPLMTPQAMMLSEQDMKNLAVYYASQQSAPKPVAAPSTVDLGEALYRGGDTETGAAACMACHGPSGRGNPAAAYPLLRGQYAVYAAKQLRDYAAGRRQSDKPQRMMQEIASKLSEEDMLAVASYVQGLK
jgi:cytochrome c553